MRPQLVKIFFQRLFQNFVIIYKENQVTSQSTHDPLREHMYPQLFPFADT